MKKRKIALSILVVAVVLVASFFTVLNPTTGKVFNGKLRELSSGSHTFTANNTTYHDSWVRLSITYTFPWKLDPDMLLFKISDSNGTFSLGHDLNNLNSANLSFSYGRTPHIVATGMKNGFPYFSTAFFGEILNPDGKVVGSTQPPILANGEPLVSIFSTGDIMVQSGAVLNITLPSASPTGFTITMHYMGAEGSSSISLSKVE